MAGILIVLLFVATGIVAVVFLFYLSYLAVFGEVTIPSLHREKHNFLQVVSTSI